MDFNLKELMILTTTNLQWQLSIVHVAFVVQEKARKQPEDYYADLVYCLITRTASVH